MTKHQRNSFNSKENKLYSRLIISFLIKRILIIIKELIRLIIQNGMILTSKIIRRIRQGMMRLFIRRLTCLIRLLITKFLLILEFKVCARPKSYTMHLVNNAIPLINTINLIESKIPWVIYHIPLTTKLSIILKTQTNW